MNADGSGNRRVADGTLATWSPDGKTIAFQCAGSTNSNICAIDSGGRHKRLLARNAFGPAPAWSPDGTQIAFVRNSSIFVMNPDGSRQRNVARNATTPVWRPAG
jgi:Tol biopolymer transport system component